MPLPGLLNYENCLKKIKGSSSVSFTFSDFTIWRSSYFSTIIRTRPIFLQLCFKSKWTDTHYPVLYLNLCRFEREGVGVCVVNHYIELSTSFHDYHIQTWVSNFYWATNLSRMVCRALSRKIFQVSCIINNNKIMSRMYKFSFTAVRYLIGIK